jgi:hypothetical protein
MNLTVSDYFYEFLSFPDQLKLIEFENKKMKELHLYQTESDDNNLIPHFDNESL